MSGRQFNEIDTNVWVFEEGIVSKVNRSGLRNALRKRSGIACRYVLVSRVSRMGQLLFRLP